VRAQLDAQTTTEIAAISGSSYADLAEAERALEQLVLRGGQELDQQLAQVFARQVERTVQLLEPLAARVAGYDLAPVVL
jgi:hypothetical protein